MFEKFKNLSKGKKIIVGIIGFLLLPITLFILSFNLAVDGVKNKKIGKVIIGLIACTVIISSVFASNKSTPAVETANTTVETEKNKSETEKQKLTTPELLKKLETYELMYSAIPASLQESAKGNDAFEMQKSFSESRDFLTKAKSELNTLQSNYKSGSNEYKAIDNLVLAYFTLSEACDYGIKYIDKNEFKYYEKFEEECETAGYFINDYLVYKGKLQ